MGVFGGRERTAADASPDGADERVASRRHRPAARRLSALASAVALLAVGGWLWGAADPAPAGGGAAGPVRRPTEGELDVWQRAEQLLIRALRVLPESAARPPAPSGSPTSQGPTR
ncbi:hypothetical protein PUR61_04490 [Streptomyces sp. BE20]|uniref:hypothetical protein n=1 Tax=Streptomyces sp. BE20 TaxID=3002525 RepID=UPI002E761D59|nr:hypothetical protein [Streptomyces sp. BE20]MEE1821460.1 hypothetical protein [Streptomyces sp. BE20]